MEESQSQSLPGDLDERFILQFVSGGLTVVLEYSGMERMETDKNRIEEAGMDCVRIPKFNPKFDQADLFMDLRSPVCIAQFDLEDWL